MAQLLALDVGTSSVRARVFGEDAVVEKPAPREPEVFRSAARFVSFAEYVYARLLDRDAIPVSTSLASGTGLLDMRTGDWDPELLDTLGVSEQRLPEISDEPVGDWFPAVIDGACSNLGTGCVTRERAALMVGT